MLIHALSIRSRDGWESGDTCACTLMYTLDALMGWWGPWGHVYMYTLDMVSYSVYVSHLVEQ